MGAAPQFDPRKDLLISRTAAEYGDRFQDHLFEQYKLYVESSQKVSEKRISTGNFLLTVNSSLLTLYGLASTIDDVGRWLAIVPLAGLLVSFTWLSLVISYKSLNTAKFKVIHELEDHLPAALFRHEWHACGLGTGNYKPITHLERWIPVIFMVVFALLGAYAILRGPHQPQTPQPVTVNGSVDVNVRTPLMIEPKTAAPGNTQPQQKRAIKP